ncbi:MAG: DUF3795 domain-containing protein [Candidatus Methanomethylicus sp.]|nr:DUF3795 domain-containing protein [Candidatus Methanomethylicus sp.]
MYQSKSQSKCYGCKSPSRIAVGCPFIKCALKKDIEFCWDCPESLGCENWEKHKRASRSFDSFVCYQKLEDSVRMVQEKGVEEFEKEQSAREGLLKVMLDEFNEGRSKTLYCIATTVFEVKELEAALSEAKKQAKGLDVKEKSRIMHQVLAKTAKGKNYILKLRK